MPTPANWTELFTAANDGDDGFLGDEFIEQWRGKPFKPTQTEQEAAARLHLQLISRITTQRLPYVDGEEATALDSVYQLFGEAREVFKNSYKTLPGSTATEAIVWHVLNTHVRPFTAKWHRLRETLAALDSTDVFRHELATLQKSLVRFAALLVAIRDGEGYVRPRDLHLTDREIRIAGEMCQSTVWCIDEKLGGIEKEFADAINAAEGRAIRDRRVHYAKTFYPSIASARAWLGRQHVSGLAISGGGIRSATFALGVLAALARRNLLYQFDYLSTVSGGGYLGAFLTTYLSGAAPAAESDEIGLMREDLPFRRDEGEAAALRHIRHHSKYLATGRLWERLQMAFAQVYGMAMNGLGFAYLAFVAAYAEYLLRLIPHPSQTWEIATGTVAGLLAATVFLVPLFRRWRISREWPDTIVTGLFVVLLLLVAWRILGELHQFIDPNQPWGIGLGVVAVICLLAAGIVTLAGNLPLPIRIALIVIAAVAAPLLFIGFELLAYAHLKGMSNYVFVFDTALVGFVLFWALFDINFTAPHRHYKKKLGEAYLIQHGPTEDPASIRENVSLKLSECTGRSCAPYHLINCALNVPASRNSQMQGRLTDFFLFSRDFCGSPLTGYSPTKTWETFNPSLDLGTAMAISGAAAAPQMGTGTIKNLSFWMALLNVRLGYWIRNPRTIAKHDDPPGLPYLLNEMFGKANETTPYVNVSDGGHIENLGVYELLRRRCKYIVAIDGEQDEKMTFQGLTTLMRLAYIDLGVKIDVRLDTLRLAASGLSHSHFAFCRIRYPLEKRDGAEECYGYLIYLKLSLTGNEGEFIKHYKLDEPAFPHTSTANQFFSEAQFEAYRSLGEHVGDKMFLPAIVGDDMAKGDANVIIEEWFREMGMNMLEPLPN